MQLKKYESEQILFIDESERILFIEFEFRAGDQRMPQLKETAINRPKIVHLVRYKTLKIN